MKTPIPSATIMGWYAYAGYPSYKKEGSEYVKALKEIGYCTEVAVDILTEMWMTYIDGYVGKHPTVLENETYHWDHWRVHPNKTSYLRKLNMVQ